MDSVKLVYYILFSVSIPHYYIINNRLLSCSVDKINNYDKLLAKLWKTLGKNPILRLFLCILSKNNSDIIKLITNDVDERILMMKIYIAGSLFNEAEIAQRKKEGEMLRKNFPQAQIVNPIDQPFNKDKSSLPSPQQIYENDAREIIDSDILIADVTNEDSGVMLAIGLAIQSKKPMIIGVNSDMRIKTANKYEIPTYGMNHFVLGAILKHGHLVYSFDQAIALIKAMS